MLELFTDLFSEISEIMKSRLRVRVIGTLLYFSEFGGLSVVIVN